MDSLDALLAEAEAFLSRPCFTRDARDADNADTNWRFTPREFASAADWHSHADTIRRRLKIALGVYPRFPRCPLNAELANEIKFSGVSVFSVRFQVFEGYYATGSLFVPSGGGPFPAIYTPHGHWAHGRLESTRLGDPMLRNANFALMGYVSFLPDMVGYNDSTQLPHDFPADARFEKYGFGAMQVQTQASIRALDFLQSLPFVDGSRLGCTGASGGGTQTFILCAIDDRVSAAAEICMVSGSMQGGCGCENANALRVGTNNMEIAALFAPKPLLITGCTSDWTADLPVKEYPYLRRLYALCGSDAVKFAYVDDEHNYNRETREACYGFFAEYLPAANNFTAEREIDLGDRSRFRFMPDVPNAERDPEPVFAAYRTAQELRRAGMSEAERRIERAELLGEYDEPRSDYKPVVLSKAEAGGTTLSCGVLRDSRFVPRLPFARFSRGGGKPVVTELCGVRAVLESGRDAIVPLIYPLLPGCGRKGGGKPHYSAFNRCGHVLRLRDAALAAEVFLGKSAEDVDEGLIPKLLAEASGVPGIF